MLQHRGQDSAGMVTTDWDRFIEHKGNGLVRDVFKEEKVMKQLKGGPGQHSGPKDRTLGSVHARRLPQHENRPTCRQQWPRSCPLPDSRIIKQQGGSAILCQLPVGHIPHPQRQPDQHCRAARHAAVIEVLLQPHAAYLLRLRGPRQCPRR